ncbi:hypothetical protein F511_16532 [Dorcoceras hygrometricum]|uniref:Uncharacterized protein n=1 Tax=Dorcoceras hygrometricum TaxID=472368 RepID=A0A2Z7B9Z1_9LAMI|nr:hypothetical protein F511_16532 [Dorcoceras hygrometricum]
MRIQLWRRRYSFGDANLALATQIQILRRRFRFGDANSLLARSRGVKECTYWVHYGLAVRPMSEGSPYDQPYEAAQRQQFAYENFPGGHPS